MWIEWIDENLLEKEISRLSVHVCRCSRGIRGGSRLCGDKLYDDVFNDGSSHSRGFVGRSGHECLLLRSNSIGAWGVVASARGFLGCIGHHLCPSGGCFPVGYRFFALACRPWRWYSEQCLLRFLALSFSVYGSLVGLIWK